MRQGLCDTNNLKKNDILPLKWDGKVYSEKSSNDYHISIKISVP